MVGTPREGFWAAGSRRSPWESDTRSSTCGACVVQVPGSLSLQRTAPTVDPGRCCASREMFFNEVQMTPYRHVTRGFLSCPIRLPIQSVKKLQRSDAATRHGRGRGAASLDGVVHADAVVVPRSARARRLRARDPEGICGSSAGVAAAGEVPGLPRCVGGVALDADAGELASGPFPVTPDA